MKIKELTIYTSNLSAQIDFYVTLLGLDLIERSEGLGSIKIGGSILNIVERDNSQPYHFAINIPSNLEDEALNWLKSRVPILMDGDIELHDFEFWNAKAIYFYDRDMNIVELIARKNLSNKSQASFSANSFLYLSEIGVPVSDIEKFYKSLNGMSGVGIHSGGFERFCAIGDEEGLFICINKNVKDWFPVGDEAFSSEFQLKFEVNSMDYSIDFVNEEVVEIPT